MVQKDLGVFQVGAWSNPKLSSRFLNKVAALPLKYNAKAYAYLFISNKMSLTLTSLV